ncbi:MAG: 1-(5-phosphoribosyl)-5-[(5-phosphoribosylamino)methylideneamino]imidazole-4-carboxamide isomerase [Chloroflexi bacterium]|nr:1-(5-phosphoribosyl)-5-[(5-phosphoribosylamino)methylideneamino]imidazole-4-carboxamide isomerase [Chloroflexota bacterium]
MEIIPAIDLRAGSVVRLVQGDYERQTTFSDDPLAVARTFEAAGAPRIHVVDLDAARSGVPAHTEVARAIAAAVSVPVELGGGMRTAADVAAALDAGVGRVVVGTAAVRDPRLVSELLDVHGPARIVVGLDAVDGLIAVSGWTESTSVPATGLMARMAEVGVRRFIATDVARDGTLSGPDFDGLAALVLQARELGGGVRVIASGGVATLDHLKRLAGLGVEGAIVGRAVYEGTVDLAEAVAELGGE